MRILKRLLKLFLLFVLFIASCFFIGVFWPQKKFESVRSPATFAITNVTLIDTKTGTAKPHQTVLVNDISVAAIGLTDSVFVPYRVETINGSGKYLLPGLWDMHTHTAMKAVTPYVFYPLYIAHGVTNIRDPDGCIKDSDSFFATNGDRRRWNAEVIAGELVGPRIVGMSCMPINGSSKALEKYPGFFSAATEKDARELVHHYKNKGIDYLKVYSLLPRAPYFALMDEAYKVGLDVVGHRPYAVSAIEASNAGQKSIEHSHIFLRECFPGAEALRRSYPGRRSEKPMQEMIAHHSLKICDEIFQVMVKNNTYWCPTHIVRKKDAFANSDSFRQDPRLKYIPLLMRLDWYDEMSERASRPLEEHERYLAYYLTGRGTIKRAYDAGVKLLAGTDAPTQVVFPGSGLHDEVIEFVAAGLTPAQALKIATYDAAEYFKLADKYGSVEAGKIADLVLLDDDPLENIENIRKINTVIFNGDIYKRKDLDRLLQFAESRAGSFSGIAKVLWGLFRSPLALDIIFGG